MTSLRSFSTYRCVFSNKTQYFRRDNAGNTFPLINPLNPELNPICYLLASFVQRFPIKYLNCSGIWHPMYMTKPTQSLSFNVINYIFMFYQDVRIIQFLKCYVETCLQNMLGKVPCLFLRVTILYISFLWSMHNWLYYMIYIK